MKAGRSPACSRSIFATRYCRITLVTSSTRASLRQTTLNTGSSCGARANAAVAFSTTAALNVAQARTTSKKRGFVPQPLHYEYKLLKGGESSANNPSNPNIRRLFGCGPDARVELSNALGPSIVSQPGVEARMQSARSLSCFSSSHSISANKGDKIRSHHLCVILRPLEVHLGTFVDLRRRRICNRARRALRIASRGGTDPRSARFASLAGFLTGKPLTLPYLPQYRAATLGRTYSSRKQNSQSRGFSPRWRNTSRACQICAWCSIWVDVDSAKWTQYAETAHVAIIVRLPARGHKAARFRTPGGGGR